MIRLHTIGVRVYYEDTDAGGIVYYANYLRFFERARTDWLRAAGINQQELADTEGLNLVVRDCSVQFLRPARLDDLLQVEVNLADPVADIGRASLRIMQRALLADDPAEGAGTERVLATGNVRLACMDRRTGRPAPLPPRILQLLTQQLARVGVATGGPVKESAEGPAQETAPGPAQPPSPGGAQASGKGSMQVRGSLPQPVSTRVMPDGTAEQQ